MEYIVGIDLGTTNSEISVVIDGAVKVIPVGESPIMPSCVGLDNEGKLLVGNPAKNQMVADPESTILSIKRKMGQEEKVMLRDRSFSPEEISSFILAELKIHAERYLGQPVKKAVITVPAYFSDRQRKATADAGALAGLEVVRIINEPTAAALAYDTDHKENQRILVYDLGGGTFDVSLVMVENGVVEVKASHGDTHLGGDDFDRLLIEHVIKHMDEKRQADISGDIKAFRRLWKACEKAKRELSDAPYVRIREEYVFEEMHVDLEISREDYNLMITPFIHKTLECVHLCLKDASMVPSDIDRILLVGGATRTPLVSSMLFENLKKEPRYEINPDLIVSMGAGLQAASIAGDKTGSVLVDITPYTFGSSAAGMYNGEFNYNIFVPVIRRNSALPVRKTEVFYTMYDNQSEVEVNIYQGEMPIAPDNIFIGKFMITGLSIVPHGNAILLNLDLDLNGMLKVTATEKNTGLSKTVTMDTRNAPANINLDDSKLNISDLLETMHLESHTGSIPLAQNEGSVESSDNAMSRAKELKKRAEKLLSTVNDEDGREIKSLMEKSRMAIEAGDKTLLAQYNESLSDMLFYLED